MTQEESWLLNEKYNGTETEEFLAECARLKSGEPLAYLIGWVSFLSAKIFLNTRPLIPRPETEYWTEKVLHEIQNTDTHHPNILDLCAGSGCIGIAVLSHIRDAEVDFVEIDENHLALIQKNITENGIDPQRTHIYGGNLFESLPEKQYDYILSNPPYIDPEIDRTDTSVRNFEPERALYGGTYGTELIFKIIEGAPQFLKPEGVLYIEHEPEQQEAITQCASQNGLEAVSHGDQFGTVRFTRFTRKKEEMV